MQCNDLFIFSSNFAVLGSLGATLLALGLFLYLSHSRTSDSCEMVDNTRPGYVIANSRLIRMAIFLIANTLIASCAVFSVVMYTDIPYCLSVSVIFIDVHISICVVNFR